MLKEMFGKGNFFNYMVKVFEVKLVSTFRKDIGFQFSINLFCLSFFSVSLFTACAKKFFAKSFCFKKVRIEFSNGSSRLCFIELLWQTIIPRWFIIAR